jgi:E3 ubiquitin-protein ligase BRE1
MRLEARTVATPSLDVVKMEDRKRPSGPDDSAPPAKRQAVTVNGTRSHQDADPMPWKEDIEVRPYPLPPPFALLDHVANDVHLW